MMAAGTATHSESPKRSSQFLGIYAVGTHTQEHERDPSPIQTVVTTRKWGRRHSYPIPMNDIYQERVWNAPDVCVSCFRLVREERPTPPEWRQRDSIKEADYSRRRDTTEVAYGPGETVSEHKGIFCSCGVEGSYVRAWDEADVDADRFRTFLKRCLRVLDHKGVSVDPKATATYALQAWRDGSDVDGALSTGIDYGLQQAEVQHRQTDPTSAD